jgi:hypothetical protein
MIINGSANVGRASVNGLSRVADYAAMWMVFESSNHPAAGSSPGARCAATTRPTDVGPCESTERPNSDEEAVVPADVLPGGFAREATSKRGFGTEVSNFGRS